MANTINGIVNCSISLESPAMSEESMSGMLLLASVADKKNGDIKHYTSLTTLEEDGYKESSDLYKAAQVAFAQDPAPDGVYVVTLKEDEEPTDAVKRALKTDGWYHVLPVGIAHEKYNALATYIETTEKLLGITLTAKEKSPITQSGLLRTHVWRLAESQSTDLDAFLHVAITAKTSSYDPGSETWALKQLSLINPGDFTETEINTMDQANENYFVCIAKKNVTQGGKVLGDEWIDTIRFRDWLKNKIQLNVYNVMLANKKIPFTDSGITLIQNALISALKAGQNAGGISEDFFDEDGNETKGFETTAPLASSFTAAQKKSRTLTGITWFAYLAGAIHVVKLTGTLGY